MRYIHFLVFFVARVFDMLGIYWFILCLFSLPPPPILGRAEEAKLSAATTPQTVALTLSGEGKIL